MTRSYSNDFISIILVAPYNITRRGEGFYNVVSQVQDQSPLSRGKWLIRVFWATSTVSLAVLWIETINYQAKVDVDQLTVDRNN